MGIFLSTKLAILGFFASMKHHIWEKILNFNVLKMILEDFDGFVIKVIKEDEFQEATDVFMEVVEGWNILKRPSKKVHGHCIDSFCS